MWHILDFLIDFLGRFFLPRSWRLDDGKFGFGDGAKDLRWIVYIALIVILFSSEATGFLSYLMAVILADLLLEFVPQTRDAYGYKFIQIIYATLMILGLIFMFLYIVVSLKTDIGGILSLQ